MLYFLATSPWFEYAVTERKSYRHAFLGRTVYRMGQRAGTAGAYFAHRYPVFPTHESAIRATTARPPLMTAIVERPALDVEAVLELRASTRGHVYDPGHHGASRYAVSYNATADTFELRASPVSPPLCAHRDIHTIGALLRGERFEPGYIAKVLDAQYAPDEIELDADAREQARRERARHDAEARARRQADEDEARRRRSLLREQDAPADLTIDDLFGSL